MTTKKDIKKIAMVMRDMTPVFTMLMCLHCGMLLLGINWRWSEVILGLLVFHVLWYSSKRIGLCTLHRAGLLYGYAVFFCCNFERVIGFGALRHPAQWVMFTLGLVITALFVKRAIEIKHKHKMKHA